MSTLFGLLIVEKCFPVKFGEHKDGDSMPMCMSRRRDDDMMIERRCVCRLSVESVSTSQDDDSMSMSNLLISRPTRVPENVKPKRICIVRMSIGGITTCMTIRSVLAIRRG